MVPNPYLSEQSPPVLLGSIEVSMMTWRALDPRETRQDNKKLTVPSSSSSSKQKIRSINKSEKGSNTGHETKPVLLDKVDEEAYDVGRRAIKV